ncbi:MAG: septum formation protein Maf [Bacteroidetes bacterium]|nr:MAG: septum formation protein Maf [Bacteroidota bacterium]
MTALPIILASQSPRRSQLLQWAEVAFEVMISATDENIPAGLPVEEVATAIAREKALTVRQQLALAHGADAQRLTHPPILAADTVVVLNGNIIGKPTDEADAINTLLQLSGKTHTVITGVVILHTGGEIAFSEATQVTFHALTKPQVEFYVRQYQPFDKAGSYAIQEWIGVVGIKSIAGDFYNVMGLPVSRVVMALNALQQA